MIVPALIWMVFLFAMGACVGSFLNVVVYRLPREMSLVTPGSHCTSCQRPLAWYDNIPVLAWFYLGGRCRYCRSPYSIRYALVELATGILFTGLYWLYFRQGVRYNLAGFEQGGWVVYLTHVMVISVLVAASLIDAELWIIPLGLSYFMAIAGCALSMAQPYVASIIPDDNGWIMPFAGLNTATLGLGGILGLGISLVLVRTQRIKRSFYELELAEQAWYETQTKAANPESKGSAASTRERLLGLQPPSPTELGVPVSVRREMMRELVFLTPVILSAMLFRVVFTESNPAGQWLSQILFEQKWLSGLSGSLFGFMIGGGLVWLVRILGTLAFGREAMGLGDVHLMAGVGAALGWLTPVLAFFVAPFAGLGWALSRLIFRKRREIPYGPFLSAATLLVMIFHDRLADYFIAGLTLRPAITPGG